MVFRLNTSAQKMLSVYSKLVLQGNNASSLLVPRVLGHVAVSSTRAFASRDLGPHAPSDGVARSQYRKATDYKKIFFRGRQAKAMLERQPEVNVDPRGPRKQPYTEKALNYDASWKGDGVTPPPGWVETRSERDLHLAWLANKNMGVDVYPRTLDPYASRDWRKSSGTAFWHNQQGGELPHPETDYGLAIDQDLPEPPSKGILGEHEFVYDAGETATRSEIGNAVDKEDLRRLIRRKNQWIHDQETFQLFYDVEHGEEDVFEAIQTSRTLTGTQKRDLEREAESILFEQEALIEKAQKEGLPEPKFPPIRMQDLGTGGQGSLEYDQQGVYILPEEGFDAWDRQLEMQALFGTNAAGMQLPGVDQLDLLQETPITPDDHIPEISFKFELEYDSDLWNFEPDRPEIRPKTVLCIKVDTLELPEKTLALFTEVVGLRYNPNTQILKMPTRKYDTSIKNTIYLFKQLHQLLEECCNEYPEENEGTMQRLFPNGPTVSQNGPILAEETVKSMTDEFLGADAENSQWNAPVEEAVPEKHSPIFERLLSEHAPQLLANEMTRDPSLKNVLKHPEKFSDEAIGQGEEDSDYEYYYSEDEA
eukprot:TRINITY_DN663_c1_g2_i2.p1 TRINITY_DN663_c1_g2~~TRINITY_DN663_c1_g2_i2.p1  ORF type:complete len:592 (-),score=135.73 TRINITY_DN663_c1_g2_i2:242-2017(-)